MMLTHIDNNFFKLTAAQAKALTLTGKLPKHGYESKADPSKLALVSLVYRSTFGLRPCAQKASQYGQAWVTRTRLRWFEGKPVAGGWVWALHLHGNNSEYQTS